MFKMMVTRNTLPGDSVVVADNYALVVVDAVDAVGVVVVVVSGVHPFFETTFFAFRGSAWWWRSSSSLRMMSAVVVDVAVAVGY